MDKDELINKLASFKMQCLGWDWSKQSDRGRRPFLEQAA